MWPTALQMTRDECRGILRRLELESYSNVISVFRAQGGLNDNKAKLLDELRTVFHISQERHRAEARRVANDEQLSTIAEAISGPNTWQEWSREGRRTFPLLPRVPPQTALSVIANNVASEATNENVKLPYPADTAKAEQTTIIDRNLSHLEKNPPIVTTDPNQQSDILLSKIKASAMARKHLKRNLPDNLNSMTNSTKKRTHFENSPQSMNQGKSTDPFSAGVNLNSSSTSIRKLYNSHSRTQTKNKKPKKNVSGVIGVSTVTKRANAGKGKRNYHQRQQKQPLVDHAAANANSPKPSEIGLSDKSQFLPASAQSVATSHQIITQSKPAITATAPIVSDHDNKKLLPQIATSKKDISKNLTKLNIPQALHDKLARVKSPILVSPTQSQSSGNLSLPSTLPKTEKQLISTPVQKYIVEDRQPPPQSMSLSQYTPVSSKVRTMNTSLVSPGTAVNSAKLQNLKQLKSNSGMEQYSMPVTSQPQVFNVIEAQQAAIVSSSPATYVIPAPPHTSPAIIQLNSNKIQDPPEHGKVLTTKLLPLMLTTANAGIGGNKLDSLNGGGSNVGTIKGNITNISAIQASNPSVFRKPNIIKGCLAKQPMTTQIAGAGNVIPNNTPSQLISNIKMPSQFQHLKSTVTAKGTSFTATTTGIGGHKSVKIYSSPNGKVFIRPDDSSKTPGKLNTHHLSLQKTITGGIQPGRVAIQKVQIIPAPHSSPGGIVNSANLLQQQKPISITSKPGMIYMPGSSSTTPHTGTIVRSLTLGKSNKPQITSNTSNINSPTIDVTKQNVFVIGSVPQTQQTSTKSNKTMSIFDESNMITEDTPVDILNMPIIVADSTGGNCDSIESTKKSSNSLSDSGVRIESVTVLQPRMSIQTRSSPGNASNYRLTHQPTSDSDADSSMSVVLGATDWEMELDQEAANQAKAAQTKANIVPGMEMTRTKSTDKFNIVTGKAVGLSSSNNTNNKNNKGAVVNSTTDHFDDVIVEESLTDLVTDGESIINNDDDCDTSSKVENTDVEEVLDIVLVDEQHPEITDNVKHENQHKTDDEETIVVDDEHQNLTIGMKEANDIIQFDDTYESVDMDDDIAIEYIEDDQEMQDAYAEKFGVKLSKDDKRVMGSIKESDEKSVTKSSDSKSINTNTNCLIEKDKCHLITSTFVADTITTTTTVTTSSFDNKSLQKDT